MQDSLELLLHGDTPLTPPQREALEEDPSLAAAVKQWLGVRAHLRERLDTELPDCRILVLHVLERSGHADALTDAERSEVVASRGAIAQAMETYGALKDVAARIEEDTEAFLKCWEMEGKPVRVLRLIPATRTWRMAAGIALFIGFGAVFALLRGGDTQMATIVVRDGQEQLVELPDGSTAFLVGPSELRYDSGAFSRSVAFDGRAFFDIVHEEDLFAVATDHAEMTVLGTRFGVRADTEKTEVVLESGRVRLTAQSRPEAPVELSPGERSVVSTGSLPTAPVSVDIVQALDWTGYVFFDTTPMSEVAIVLQERFGVRVDVGKDLLSEQVSGFFEPSDMPERILDVLAVALDAQVTGDSVSGFSISR